MNREIFGFPSFQSVNGCEYLDVGTWKVRKTLQSEQGLWLFPQYEIIFIISPGLSFNGLQQKVDDSDNTKVTLACGASRALMNLGATV